MLSQRREFSNAAKVLAFWFGLTITASYTHISEPVNRAKCFDHASVFGKQTRIAYNKRFG